MQRVDYATAAPEALRTMLNLEQYVRTCGLEPSLIALVKLRASYGNGCGFCVDMHTKDALAAGESAQRLFAVAVWKETPFFTPRERAALAWTDALIDLGDTHVPDDVYNEVRAHFTDAELTNLTMAVIAINGWNMLAIGFRVEPGSYQPRSKAAA